MPEWKAPWCLPEVRAEKGENHGYNAATDTYGDLVKDGVIDPAKVTRIALQNAASIAGLMLTTEALIAELPERGKDSCEPSCRRDGRRDVLTRVQLAAPRSMKWSRSCVC